jgi:hypothetical protein
VADYELVINVRGNDQTGSLDTVPGRLGRIGEIAAGSLSADVFRRIGASLCRRCLRDMVIVVKAHQ